MTSKDEKKVLDVPNKIAVLDEKNANIIIWDGKRPIRSGKSYLLSIKYKNGIFFVLSAKGGTYSLAPTLQRQYGVVLKYENVGWDKISDQKSFFEPYTETSEVYPIPDSILLSRKPIDMIFYGKGVLIMDNYGILRFDVSSIELKYIFRSPYGELPINMFIIGPGGGLSEEHIVVSIKKDTNTVYIINIRTEIFRSGNPNKTAIKHPEKNTLITVSPNSIDEFDYSWNKLNQSV